MLYSIAIKVHLSCRLIKSPSTGGKRFHLYYYVLAKVQSFYGRESEKS